LSRLRLSFCHSSHLPVSDTDSPYQSNRKARFLVRAICRTCHRLLCVRQAPRRFVGCFSPKRSGPAQKSTGQQMFRGTIIEFALLQQSK
jgi:hypothetical protein